MLPKFDINHMRQSADFRRGHAEDQDWLFQLFRTTMQDFIDQAWGWEELLQREGFATSLPAREFQIIEATGTAVASYHLTRNSDHLLLDMIMVEPSRQRQGYGRMMMAAIKAEARNAQLPVRLSVLQTNPAIGFHEHEGFIEYSRDQHSLQMIWVPDFEPSPGN